MAAGADVDLHIQCRASGACVHRVCVCIRRGKSNRCHEYESGKSGTEVDGAERNEGGITIIHLTRLVTLISS